MKAALDALFSFIIARLPDSIRERKDVLNAMLLVMPAKHPLRDRVEGLRLHLESHEQHQLQLALDFKAATASAIAHDGDGQGNGTKSKR